MNMTKKLLKALIPLGFIYITPLKGKTKAISIYKDMVFTIYIYEQEILFRAYLYNYPSIAYNKHYYKAVEGEVIIHKDEILKGTERIKNIMYQILEQSPDIPSYTLKTPKDKA